MSDSTSESFVIAQPESATHLVLLFHGVGATAAGLRPLGERVAAALPQACVVSVSAPNASDLGQGRQWFSVRGITEDSRLGRVTEAMPRFIETVRHWQGVARVGAAETTLLGFSQGAIMSLESTQQNDHLADRLIAIAGRFAQPARRAPQATHLHLMHGTADAVMPVALSHAALDQLKSLGCEATLDLFAGLGHGIDAHLAHRITERLRSA